MQDGGTRERRRIVSWRNLSVQSKTELNYGMQYFMLKCDGKDQGKDSPKQTRLVLVRSP